MVNKPIEVAWAEETWAKAREEDEAAAGRPSRRAMQNRAERGQASLGTSTALTIPAMRRAREKGAKVAPLAELFHLWPDFKDLLDGVGGAQDSPARATTRVADPDILRVPSGLALAATTWRAE